MRRAALYLRRSTDEKRQPESLDVQESRLRDYAARHQLEVVDVFADSASGLSVKGRKGFARLLTAVENGPPPFDTILVRDISRFGRFQNVDESAYWDVYLLLHGVKVVYAEETFASTPRPYDSLMKTIRRIVAAEYSREKGRLVQAAQAYLVKRGFRFNGQAPYGMTRIAVTREGRYVRALRPGERKESVSLRVKLAPGTGQAAKTVRQIFRWFVRDELKLAEIARRLNASGIPTPKRRAWDGSGVKSILSNAAYGGICRATFSTSENFSEVTMAESENAWQGLVTLEEFRAAEQRLVFRPRANLDSQLRAAVSEWVPDTLSAASLRSFTEDSMRGEIALEEVGRIAPAAITVVTEALNKFKQVIPTMRGVVLNGVFELGIRYSFPRLHEGRLTWEFRTSAANPEDATLFVGLAPLPEPRVARLFLLFTRRLKRLGKVYRPEVLRSSFYQLRNLAPAEVAAHIDRYLYSGSRAKQILLEALHGLKYANTALIARQLGWPEGTTYGVYYRLRKGGVVVPPLVWHAKRKVKWICDGCGTSLELTIRGASRIKHDRCEQCREVERVARRHRVFSCRTCGAERRLTQPVIGDRYATGDAADAQCRACSGRTNIIAAHREYTRRSKLLRRAYRKLAGEIVNILRKRLVAPRSEAIDGVMRLISFEAADGSRRFARLLLKDVDTAAALADGNRRHVARIARAIAKETGAWSCKKTAPASLDVADYTCRPMVIL